MSPYRALEVINKEIESGRQTVSVNKALRAAETALKMQIMSECKKLYVVTADTHTDGWGSWCELLRVADNKVDRDESINFAKNRGWEVNVIEVVLNKRVREFIGGYIE